MNTLEKENSIKNVVVLGKFDGIHRGHQKLISTAVSIAAKKGMKTLVCTITSPDATKNITTEEKKEEIIKSLGADFVLRQYLTEEFKKLSPEEFAEEILIKKFNAAHVVVGYNFKFGANRMGDTKKLTELCRFYNIEITVIDSVNVQRDDGTFEPISSTVIRSLIENGKVDTAKEYLGRFFCMWGIVKEGKHLGRKLGFPTVNLYPAKTELVPKYGVYVVKVYVDKNEYYGITNVGINPTVEEKDNTKVETYIFDFEKTELYGKTIRLKFLEFVREETKFKNIDELKDQIEKDKEYVIKKYL